MCSFVHSTTLSWENYRLPLQLVTMRIKKMRKYFPAFVKDNYKYTTKWLVKRCQILHMTFFGKSHRFGPKIPGRRTIIASFYYLQ